MPRRKKPIEPDAPEVEVTPTPVPEPIVVEPEAENLVIELPTDDEVEAQLNEWGLQKLNPKPAPAATKKVVVVDVNAGQAVYIDGVKVSGKERRRHMEDVCHSLKRGDVIELQHWHCAGCQMFEGQVREAGFPAKLSDLPEPRDEYVHPKP